MTAIALRNTTTGQAVAAFGGQPRQAEYWDGQNRLTPAGHEWIGKYFLLDGNGNEVANYEVVPDQYRDSGGGLITPDGHSWKVASSLDDYHGAFWLAKKEKLAANDAWLESALSAGYTTSINDDLGNPVVWPLNSDSFDQTLNNQITVLERAVSRGMANDATAVRTGHGSQRATTTFAALDAAAIGFGLQKTTIIGDHADREIAIEAATNQAELDAITIPS